MFKGDIRVPHAMIVPKSEKPERILHPSCQETSNNQQTRHVAKDVQEEAPLLTEDEQKSNGSSDIFGD